MQIKKYNVQVNNYVKSQYIPVAKNCNGFTVTNIGDTALTINDIILFPSATPATVLGDSVSIGGNEGEIYTGNLKLSFLVPVGAAPNVQIIQKYYLEDQKK